MSEHSFVIGKTADGMSGLPMVPVTLCADNLDVSDQVFTVHLKKSDVSLFVSLVKNGWRESGLTKPALIIKGENGEQVASERNSWQVDIEVL